MATGFDEKAVFLAALALPAEARDAFLRGACPDETSRQRVEALLAHHGRAGTGLHAAAAVGAPAETPARLDEFQILGRLGEGGMGVVYLAQDTILGRRVALKVIASHLAGSEEALARFREEAKNAAALRHPVIVPVFKFGSAGGVHYLASEFVDGPTLAAAVAQERGRRAADRRAGGERAWHQQMAAVTAAVADALDSSHRARIIHCDIKPSNILLDHERGPRLTDFGIAKHLTDGPRSGFTAAVGSCHYMSPEQASIAGASVDGRSDLFSLGVVLYEALSLARPFDGGNVSQVLSAVIRAEPARVRSLDRSIPRDLETICHKALRKDPAERYQTAAHMAADLRCYLEGLPILARPPGPVAKARRLLRAHPRALAAALILVLFAALAGSGLLIRHQRGEALCWARVETGSLAGRAYLTEFDPVSLAPRPARPLGRTPIGTLKLPLGQYRLTVVRDADTALGEVNLLLLSPGRAGARRVRVVEPSTPVARGELAVVLRSPREARSGMLRVDAGRYSLRRPAASHPVLAAPTELPAFYIDPTQVSNRQYKEFVEATGYPPPAPWSFPGFLESALDLPVLWVALEDAEAYARWKGKRLPSVLEWQAAARGAAGRLYPGGDEPPRVPPPPEEPLTSEALMRQYAQAATRVDEPDPWDPPSGPRHTFGNVRELTETVNPASREVLLVGRAWSDPAARWDLSKILTMPISAAPTRGGFRCALSAAPPEEVKSP